ncbi:MAG: FAD synthase [Candidatus Altiarchaeales archaeon]|nr:MAG: FAD synthase [Candidatus Altiarchaeales archaeon]
MKIVVATGVFDILHPGHVLFLEEAKKLGDRLIVIVARDKTVEERKNNLAIPEKQRLDVVKALKPVDKALLGDEEDIFRPIREIDPDIIALGRDQHFDEEKLEKELKKRGLKARVVRIERYLEEGLNSSRRIIEKIREC